MLKRILYGLLSIILLPFRIMYEIVDFLYLNDYSKILVGVVYCIITSLIVMWKVGFSIYDKNELLIYIAIDVFICIIVCLVNAIIFEPVVRLLDKILTPIANVHDICFEIFKKKKKQYKTGDFSKEYQTRIDMMKNIDTNITLDDFIRTDRIEYPELPYCKYISTPCEGMW